MIKKILKKLKSVTRYLSYLKKYWKILGVIVFLSIISVGINIVNPLILRMLIDDGFAHKNQELFNQLLILMVGLGLTTSVINYFSTVIKGILTGNVVIDMRKDIFNHSLFLPFHFFVTNSVGDIVQKVFDEINHLRDFITNGLIRLINNSLMIIGYFTALCIINIKLLAVFIILFPLTIISINYFRPKIKSAVAKIRQKDSAILSFLFERYSKIKAIQVSNLYENEENIFNKLLRTRYVIGMQRIRLNALNGSINGFIFSISMTVLFFYGGYLIISGELTVGGLLAFINLLVFLINPIKDSQRLYMEFIQASVSIERIDQINTQTTIHPIGNDSKPFVFEDHIEFKDVSFCQEDKRILKKVNFSLQKGKTYALVGISGSGKTTIINLLEKFYSPTSGQILIDNVDLEEIDIFDLRKHVSYITQEDFVFNDSIIENIRRGNLNASKEEIVSATEKVILNKYIESLKDNLQTVIGENGAKLSGGERQKLALSRVFIQKPDIIVLDESFASLDSENEKVIMDNIKSSFPNAVIIVISHRLSTIKQVDSLIFLANGEVKGQNDQEKLFTENVELRKLFKEQVALS